VDGGARNAAARLHSLAHDGVDGGINSFGHGGDGSDRAMAASDSGGRDSEAKWRVRAAARDGDAGGQRLSERLLSRPARSDTAAHGSQSGAAQRDTAADRRARRSATLPLTGGPGADISG
jgi:hypothetical protein